MSFGGHNTVTQTPVLAPAPTPSPAIGTPGTPTPPDAILASSNAAVAAKAVADRARKRLMGAGTLLTGTPGATTPGAITSPVTLLGGGPSRSFRV